MTSSILERYKARVDQRTPGISSSITKTVSSFKRDYLDEFTFQEHCTALLLGEVQSGKTAQVFGIISAMADKGFKLFILLTTDSVGLQRQTYRRALADLEQDFNICDETDEDRFIQGKLQRPILLVLKKNSRILAAWKDNIAFSGYCAFNPLVIIDDEADAASLNTKVNLEQKSPINTHLESIRNLANSSVFLQVTATPQAVLLQSKESGWKPGYVLHFPPGRGYLGGRFFYSEPPSFAVRKTAETELDDLLDESKLTKGLEKAIMSFLITGAHLLSTESETVCNFLIHPSARIEVHGRIRAIVGMYIDDLSQNLQRKTWLNSFYDVWCDLQNSKPDLLPYSVIVDWLMHRSINVHVINSQTEIPDYSRGLNIIIGGNSLGRGVTFPVLQTVYYCRSSKSPQADTFWQHSRMFGYDREPGLMRLFLPASLLDLFTELSSANQMLIEQIKDSSTKNIGLLYPTNIKPTRRNVLADEVLQIIIGGTNYFPRNPEESNLNAIDALVVNYPDGEHEINYELAISICLL